MADHKSRGSVGKPLVSAVTDSVGSRRTKAVHETFSMGLSTSLSSLRSFKRKGETFWNSSWKLASVIVNDSTKKTSGMRPLVLYEGYKRRRFSSSFSPTINNFCFSSSTPDLSLLPSSIFPVDNMIFTLSPRVINPALCAPISLTDKYAIDGTIVLDEKSADWDSSADKEFIVGEAGTLLAEIVNETFESADDIAKKMCTIS